MGQAKRRKELGIYPEYTPKPRAKNRIKPNEFISGFGGFYKHMLGTSGTFGLLAQLAQHNRELGEVRE